MTALTEKKMENLQEIATWSFQKGGVNCALLKLVLFLNFSNLFDLKVFLILLFSIEIDYEFSR